MKALAWLVRKDLWRFFADRQGALMTVLVPVVLASLLGAVFAPRDKSAVVALLVSDEDGSPPTRKLVGRIAASESFTVTEVDRATAERKIGAGDAPVALLLPKGVGRALRPAAMFSAQRGQAELLHDPSREIEVNLAEGLLTRIMMEQMGEVLGGGGERQQMFRELERDLDERGRDDATSGSLRRFLRAGVALEDDRATRPGGGAQPSAFRPPVELHKRAAEVSSPESRGYNSYAHNFAGMLLMFLLFAAQSAAKQLATERSEGTLLRLRASPVRPAVLLLGTALSTTVIALLSTAVVYAVGMLAFGVRVLGSWPGFGLVVLAQALFVGGFALLLAGLGRTEQQIGAVGTFVVLVLSFAGGAMFPSFMMPHWLQVVSQALPTYWATRGLAAMTWRALPLGAALLPAAVLALAALLCGAVGLAKFRWE